MDGNNCSDNDGQSEVRSDNIVSENDSVISRIPSAYKACVCVNSTTSSLDIPIHSSLYIDQVCAQV